MSIAEKIVEKFASETTESEVLVQNEIDRDDKKREEKFETKFNTTLVGVLGYGITSEGDTAEESKANLVQMIQDDIDNEVLVLSDEFIVSLDK
jgi:hypothetical protein